MFFKDLDTVIKKIIQQPEWDNYRAYLKIAQCWHQIVNQKAVKNTRTLSFEKNTLYVATSSATWAQELALQRYSLIKKLNSRLNFTVKDIRFSPAKWSNKQKQIVTEIPLQAVNPIQKKLEQTEPITEETEQTVSPNIAVNNWLERVKNNSHLKPCPQCNAFTPQVELKRWQVCRYCIAQKWNSEYRPPTEN